jgi:hypothetical protein
MGTILLIILGVAAVVGIIAYVGSNKSDPVERVRDAAGAAAVGGLASAGCLLRMIIAALPVLIGLLLIGLLIGSCS